MHIEVDRQAERVRGAGRGAARRAREACASWSTTGSRCATACSALIDELESAPPAGVDAAEVDEARACLAWLADHHFTFLGYREYALDEDDAARRRGHRARAAARRGPRPRLDRLREAAAGRARARPRAAPAGPDQGQRALADPPPELPRLRRRQALRRRRQRGRRAPLPRPLHDRRLPRGVGQHPGAAAQGAGGARARRVPARQPRRQGAGRDHRHVPARRAVPDRRSTSSTGSRAASSSWASASACGCSCARTATSGSCRASSSSRATASTRPTASGSARSCARRSAPRPSTGGCG